MRLLIVEDDFEFGMVLTKSLTRAGYLVDQARTGAEGLWALRAQAYTAILLDLGLPDVDGLTLLREARAAKIDVPIIILSGKAVIDQRIAGLDAGADDYMVKPFDLDELEARLRVHIRRQAGLTRDLILVGDLELHLSLRSVRRSGVPITLSAQEFRLLSVLMLRQDRFVSKAQIEAALYDHTTEVESNTVEVAIYGLRKKLGSERIINRRNFGYRIV